MSLRNRQEIVQCPLTLGMKISARFAKPPGYNTNCYSILPESRDKCCKKLLYQYDHGFIVVDVEDGLKFACIDFSSQQQKRRKALCIQTDLFLSFPITQPSFPINPTCMALITLDRSCFANLFVLFYMSCIDL